MNRPGRPSPCMCQTTTGRTGTKRPTGKRSASRPKRPRSALRYSIQLDTTDVTVTPSVTSFTLEYEEGYPDRPRIDVGNDSSYDEVLLFLNESSVDASDDSIVGQDVKDTPTLVSAFNDAIPDNGDGTVDITLAVKAASRGASRCRTSTWLT